MKKLFSKKPSYKKFIVVSFVTGAALSSISAFASTGVIPATVIVEEDPVVPVLSASVSPLSLEFRMTRGNWDSNTITIENTGNVDFHPEITYTTTDAAKFDGATADILTTDKLILKSGNGDIYDFASPSAYLPNSITKIANGETVSATIEVGAGKQVPEDFVEPSFDVNVNAVQ